MHRLILGRLSMAGGLFLALSLIALNSGCTRSATPAVSSSRSTTADPIQVEAVRIEAGEVSPEVNLVGTVVAARRSLVGSAVDGRVTRIDFEAGDLVDRVGAPIAQLLTDTISIEIAAAAAQLQLREQQLAELEAGSRDEEIRQAEAGWEAAKAGAAYAQARFERLDALYQQAGSVSREEFEEARSAARTTAQQLLAARAAYDLAIAGPRPEQIEQARASLAQQQEEVNRLQDTLEQHTIRSPFAGYILAKHTEVGAWLSRGDPVIEIAELDPVDVEVQVPESLVSGLQLGAELPVTVDALPSEQNQFVGTIHRIVPGADLRARTFPVMIRLHNRDTGNGYLLKDGMLARVSVAGPPSQAKFIPRTALLRTDDATAVLIVEQGPDSYPVARRVYVETGREREASIEVKGDLRWEDRVITSGQDRIRTGQAVEVQ